MTVRRVGQGRTYGVRRPGIRVVTVPVAAPTTPAYLLLESGSYVLLESGSKIKLESSS